MRKKHCVREEIQAGSKRAASKEGRKEGHPGRQQTVQMERDDLRIGYFFMGLHAVQFALQPLLTKVNHSK